MEATLCVVLDTGNTRLQKEEVSEIIASLETTLKKMNMKVKSYTYQR